MRREEKIRHKDLITHLEKHKDIQEYLKVLIRKDMVPRRDSAARVEKDFNATLALMRQLGKNKTIRRIVCGCMDP